MNGMIDRDPIVASRAQYDLVVVGGGIYGVMLTLESARRGLRPLLLERDDYGAATSWNSLRIIHGGLRYLQKADLARFRESIAERQWWLREFPDLVEPLTCLMPLYGRGLKRPAIFRLALAINAWLSPTRNQNLRPDRCLPPGRVVTPVEVVELFPQVDRAGLRGGGVWYDAIAPDLQRLIIECLHWACACGATCLNYVRAERLLRAGDGVAGVEAADRIDNRKLAFCAPVVINAAGPWCREVAAAFDRDYPQLFRPSVAFNVLLNREPLSSAALAVAPRRKGAGMYFVVPWKGRILAGTYHAPRPDGAAPEPPDNELVGRYLEDLNAAIPGMDLALKDVLRVHWGYLPAARAGLARQADRPVVMDHAVQGGPRGLFSVSGVKFTTARRVAGQVLESIAARRLIRLAESNGERPTGRTVPTLSAIRQWLRESPDQAQRFIAQLRKEESAITVEDLLLRRTDWGMDPRQMSEMERMIEALTRLACSRGQERSVPCSYSE
jgi:glycerol-3-phosphate dehydrogenase